MPKQLINTVGSIIVLAVIAAGVMLVAFPIYLQSVGVAAETRSVAATNDSQQAHVDALSELDASDVEDSLEELMEQIPGTPRMDGVSALITDAAAATGVTMASFMPGEQTVFAPGATVDATAPTSTDDALPAGEKADGMVQVAVQVTATAPDLPAMLTFLDTLREGPRLLGDLRVSVSTRNGAADATIDAFAFAYVSSVE